MTSKSIVQLFEQYRHSRLNFVRSLSDLALRQSNVEILIDCGALETLKPLLDDNCRQVQQYSTITLGRLAHNNAKIAKKIVDANYLPILLQNLINEKQHLQKSCILFVFRSLARHNSQLAQTLIAAGVLRDIIDCLEDFEIIVKESAVWTVGYIARHEEKLAQNCVDLGCVPLLIQCLQQSHLSLKQITASCLSDIAKHSINLAQIVIDNGAIPSLVENLNNSDVKLKCQILIALHACVKHSNKFVELLMETEAILPTIFMHMKHDHSQIRRNSTILIGDIVKHSLGLSRLIVDDRGLDVLIEILAQDTNEVRVPCIIALGYIAGHLEEFASLILAYNAIKVFREILSNDDNNENLLAVTVWTLGQIGKHSLAHSNAVASANLFARMMELYKSTKYSSDLKFKIETTLKQCLDQCYLLSALEPLLYDTPPTVLECVVRQFTKILPNDAKARRLFVTTGALRRLQEINAEPGSGLAEYRTLINSCFPEEIVNYYSPDFSKILLEKVEKYTPQ